MPLANILLLAVTNLSSLTLSQDGNRNPWALPSPGHCLCSAFTAATQLPVAKLCLRPVTGVWGNPASGVAGVFPVYRSSVAGPHYRWGRACPCPHGQLCPHPAHHLLSLCLFSCPPPIFALLRTPGSPWSCRCHFACGGHWFQPQPFPLGGPAALLLRPGEALEGVRGSAGGFLLLTGLGVLKSSHPENSVDCLLTDSTAAAGMAFYRGDNDHGDPWFQTSSGKLDCRVHRVDLSG